MTEDFLYHVWQLKNYKLPLITTDGQMIQVMEVGKLNHESGPDFSEARVQIGNALWTGQIEMHLKSSDWNRHGHSMDAAYDSVILHVVYEHDMDIFTKGGNKLDVLELKDKIDVNQYYRYKELLNSQQWVACSNQLQKVNDFKTYSWLDRLLIERLENKTNQIEELLSQTNNNWEQAFYLNLARNFGFNVNAEPFEQLARNTPIEILARYMDSIFQLEAILFGQSSLLNDQIKDSYLQELNTEYKFLQHKHQLEAIPSHLWKFMRMRPVNFPTIRLAQFAQLLHQSSHLFSVVINTDKLEDLNAFFKLMPSDYWHYHYVFGKKTKESKKAFGKSSFDLILINTIVPFLFVYANHQNQFWLKDRAILFLQHTVSENNTITKRFSADGIKSHHAGHSQALIELKNNYCSAKRCLHCAIGLQLIKGV